ncbi:MAG: type 1 glutamine amidotransferase domain-containing protein [Bdellovibrionales bacterium]|nr:type 1 glutamine amidotransferase domain-containing protein [Bdellovibrionales bacterium]
MKTNILAAITLALSAQIVAAAQPFARVLIVLPGVDYVSLKGGGQHSTGYFLNEFATPLMALTKLGAEVEIATPQGVPPTMDKASDKASWFATPQEYEAAKNFVASLRGLANPRSLESLTSEDLTRFDSLFVPGGHASMEDLPKNEAMGRVLRHFHDSQKPTALICHGPAALLSAVSGGGWIYAGYKMTVFSTAEEQIEESNGDLGGLVTFYVEQALRSKGALIEVAMPWASHAFRDRELITGQNPMSDKAVAELLIEALVERKVKQLPLSTSLDLTGRKVFDVQQGSRQVDWSQGHTTFYVGVRRTEVSSSSFGKRLEAHIQKAKSAFAPKALKGYRVIATPEYEIAFQNWTNEATMNETFAQVGAPVVADAEGFMRRLVFKGVHSVPEFSKLSSQKLSFSCSDVLNRTTGADMTFDSASVEFKFASDEQLYVGGFESGTEERFLVARDLLPSSGLMSIYRLRAENQLAQGKSGLVEVNVGGESFWSVTYLCSPK